jgi:sorbitol-specific phosphotransferase system component IIC
MAVKQMTRDFGDGTYAVQFIPTILGKCRIEIAINERHILNIVQYYILNIVQYYILNITQYYILNRIFNISLKKNKYNGISLSRHSLFFDM